MKNLKKMACIGLALLFALSITACGNKNSTDGNVSTVSSTTQNTEEPKTYTIGNLTVTEVMAILKDLTLNDGLLISLTKDGTNEEYHSAEYRITTSKGTKLGSISVSSDLENKAASLRVSWNYNKTTADRNKSLTAAAKTIIIACWPDYTEEYLKVVEETVAFETSFLNAFRNENTTYASGAIGGSISVGIVDGIVTFAIFYPNLIENV